MSRPVASMKSCRGSARSRRTRRCGWRDTSARRRNYGRACRQITICVWRVRRRSGKSSGMLNRWRQRRECVHTHRQNMNAQELEKIREEWRRVLTEKLEQETKQFQLLCIEAFAGVGADPAAEKVSRAAMLAFVSKLRLMTDRSTT